MASTDDYARQIEAHIPDARASVNGDGGKFEATVVSDAFEGKNLLAKHRMVYAALDEHIKSGAIHALSIRAYTPAEWAESGGEA
ncbi:MAG: BolA/IbaG family iron-sulfur metabolism protein [Halofilum sp. (in: g-proteobacteria)]|nr:BolA/IbaG family iron-sulfur metabolism protein [Halofilum sp. (in: g-proteobacteria)]